MKCINCKNNNIVSMWLISQDVYIAKANEKFYCYDCKKGFKA